MNVHYVRHCKENAPIYMYCVAPETPMMSSVIANCPDLAPPNILDKSTPMGTKVRTTKFTKNPSQRRDLIGATNQCRYPVCDSLFRWEPVENVMHASIDVTKFGDAAKKANGLLSFEIRLRSCCLQLLQVMSHTEQQGDDRRSLGE